MFAKAKVMYVVALVTILSLTSVASAMAQSTPGSGTYAAAGNQTGLVTLNPGQQHSYTFLSAYADSKAGDAAITALLASTPEGAVTYNIWTPTELQNAAAGGTDINAKPVGAGTLHPYTDNGTTYDRFGGMLEWTGKSGEPQVYVIQVQSKAATPAQYNLMVNGNYVQFPDGTLPAQAARQGAPPAAPAITNVGTNAAAASSTSAASLPAPALLPSTGQSAVPAPGSSPNTALPLNGAMHRINPGQSQWFVVHYPGQLPGGYTPTGTLELIAAPQGGAGFNVWTADRFTALALGDTKAGVPTGAGTLHPTTSNGVTTDRFGGNPSWTNKSDTAFTYYIQVQATGNNPASYTLEYIQQ